MRVAEIMRKDVVVIPVDASVAEAVAILADQHVSGAPVVNHAGDLVGALSSTDILLAEAEHTSSEAREALFEDTRVDEIMTRTPVTVEMEAPLREAAQIMLYGDVHRVFVTHRGRLVGVVSRSDVARLAATGR